MYVGRADQTHPRRLRAENLEEGEDAGSSLTIGPSSGGWCRFYDPVFLLWGARELGRHCSYDLLFGEDRGRGEFIRY